MYAVRLRQDKEEAQLKIFLNIFKQLHINILLVEVLFQMLKYTKFMKDLLTNKRKLEEADIVALNWNCIDILPPKILRKMRDSGSSVIPYMIGGAQEKTLADSGKALM